MCQATVQITLHALTQTTLKIVLLLYVSRFIDKLKQSQIK